jgi:hypothetical protein
LAVYQSTSGFPREERYGLTSQRGDAVLLFLRISLRVAGEIQMPISPLWLLARERQLIDSGNHDQLSHQATELKGMLTALHHKLTAER